MTHHYNIHMYNNIIVIVSVFTTITLVVYIKTRSVNIGTILTNK